MKKRGCNSAIVGVDIGGANLKLADTAANALAAPFPLWTDFARLAERLRELLESLERSTNNHYRRLAVTMTGEMADCFESRREGVSHILAEVSKAFPNMECCVYAVGGKWLTPQQARQSAWDVAASNWHALAAWVLTEPFCDPGQLDLVLDIGSTTVDAIPVRHARVATAAKSDRQRLELGQLIYTGMQRTPVSAIVRALTVDGSHVPVVAERFATSDDVYLLLEWTNEDTTDLDTADGRPRTKAAAHGRMARMIGEDIDSLNYQQARAMAEQIADTQASQIVEAVSRNLPIDKSTVTLAISGHGSRLAQQILQLLPCNCRAVWLDEQLPSTAIRCAPALAVARLLDIATRSIDAPLAVESSPDMPGN